MEYTPEEIQEIEFNLWSEKMYLDQVSIDMELEYRSEETDYAEFLIK